MNKELNKVSGGSVMDTIKGKLKDNGGDALGTLLNGKKEEKPKKPTGIEMIDPFQRKKMWD